MEKVKKEIKAIIFDLGGVIIFFDHMGAARLIDKKLGVSEKEAFQVLSGNKSRFIEFCENGAPEKEYWELFTKILKTKKIFPKTLTKFWNTIFWPNKQIISFLPKLKHYKLGLISNIDLGHKKHLLKKYRLNSKFDALTFSCDIKSRKPFPKIYQTTLRKLKASPKETIFVDDLAKNTNGAKRLGMHTILFKSNKQLFEQLKQLGVRV
jgi:epoxide hydrolase-like predicted phosphatase